MLPLDGSKPPLVVEAGRDFYSYPRVSPDGLWLAFTCWDHPNMPWDETELWVTPAHEPGPARPLAGGKGESVFAPAWDSQDRLRFVSDRDGWWNLYRTVADLGAPDADRDLPPVEQLSAEQADLGHPQWVFGMQTHAELEDGTIVVIRTEAATEQLFALDAGGGALRDLGLPFTSFGAPSLSTRGGKVAFAAASPASEPRDRRPRRRERRRSRRSAPPPRRSRRRPRLGAAGDRVPDSRRRRHRARLLLPADQRRFRRAGGRTAAADRGQPRRPDRPRDPGARPRVPLLDQPRLRRRRRQLPRLLRLRARLPGEAERDLGRGRHRGLRRAAATYLAESGEVDGRRLAIRGGSAGGYATLCALVFHDEFAAGASYYGVADTETLARDTHKFEARYLDGLIGPYPERADLYRERSPIHFVERLSAPVILFQGLEDEIVPPNQAETMVAAMAANGIPPRLPRLRGRAARLPQVGDRDPLPRSGALLLRPDPRLRARRRAAAGRDRALSRRSGTCGRPGDHKCPNGSSPGRRGTGGPCAASSSPAAPAASAAPRSSGSPPTAGGSSPGCATSPTARRSTRSPRRSPRSHSTSPTRRRSPPPRSRSPRAPAARSTASSTAPGSASAAHSRRSTRTTCGGSSTSTWSARSPSPRRCCRCCGGRRARWSCSARSAAASRCPSAAPTTRPSSRSRRSPTAGGWSSARRASASP